MAEKKVLKEADIPFGQVAWGRRKEPVGTEPMRALILKGPPEERKDDGSGRHHL